MSRTDPNDPPMKILELYPMRDESTLTLLKNIDTKSQLRMGDDSCYWLGSVSMNDKRALGQFLKAADDENLLELEKHTSMDDPLAYAILVQDAKTKTRLHLFIIQSDLGLWSASKMLFGKMLSAEYSVVVKTEEVLPEHLKPQPKLELWKSFLAGFLGK